MSAITAMHSFSKEIVCALLYTRSQSIRSIDKLSTQQLHTCTSWTSIAWYYPHINTNYVSLCFYKPGACSAPGWSYSYVAIFVSICLLVCLSVCARSGNELMAAAGTYGCFELAGLFAKGSQAMPVLSTVEAQL